MTRNDWVCPVPGHGKRLSGYTRPYCPHSGHDKTGGHFFDSTGAPVNAGSDRAAALEPPALRPFRPGGGLPLPPPGPDRYSAARTGADTASAAASASVPASDLGLFPAVRGNDAG